MPDHEQFRSDTGRSPDVPPPTARGKKSNGAAPGDGPSIDVGPSGPGGEAINVGAAPESIFDDLENLRRTATLKVSRRIVPVNVAVRKPANNVYFRCHPDERMALDDSIIVGPDGSDDYYFVMPYMLDHHVITPRLRQVTIAVTYTWPGGSVSLWPCLKAEETRIACWKSARAAYEQSKQHWTQLIWNADRRDYDVAIAEGINVEPAWPPDLNMTRLLKLGFADRIIATPDHAYVKQLRGLAD
jgi:hypothetical protein